MKRFNLTDFLKTACRKAKQRLKDQLGSYCRGPVRLVLIVEVVGSSCIQDDFEGGRNDLLID